MSKLAPSGQQLERLDFARKSVAFEKSAMASLHKVRVTQEEFSDLWLAVRTATLRLQARGYFLDLRRLDRSTIGKPLALFCTLSACSWLIMPGLEYLTRDSTWLDHLGYISFGFGWIVYWAIFYGVYRAQPFAIASLLPVPVLIFIPWGHRGDWSHTSFVALHELLGFGMNLATCCLVTKVFISRNQAWIASSRRIRARDLLLISLVECATVASDGLSKSAWDNANFARRFTDTLRRCATRIELAPRCSRRTKWYQMSLRSDENAPYFAVAAAVRGYTQKVVMARSRADWMAICESLADGAIAAAGNDWSTLLADAPAEGRVGQYRAMRFLYRFAPSVMLAASGIILPLCIRLGVYGSSVRALLIVTAVLSLLPKSAGGDTVTETLAKALPFRGNS